MQRFQLILSFESQSLVSLPRVSLDLHVFFFLEYLARISNVHTCLFHT